VTRRSGEGAYRGSDAIEKDEVRLRGSWAACAVAVDAIDEPTMNTRSLCMPNSKQMDWSGKKKKGTGRPVPFFSDPRSA
jgi:hypothetical protein